MVAFSAMTSVLSLYLRAEFGLTEKTIGPIFAYVGVLSLVMRSLLLGPIVDRLGESWTMRAGTLLLAAGLLLYPIPRVSGPSRPSSPWCRSAPRCCSRPRRR